MSTAPTVANRWLFARANKVRFLVAQIFLDVMEREILGREQRLTLIENVPNVENKWLSVNAQMSLF
jgi:hypothetical protein